MKENSVSVKLQCKSQENIRWIGVFFNWLHYINILFPLMLFLQLQLFTIYICKSKATPAKTHLEGLSLDLKLKVQMYVSP